MATSSAGAADGPGGRGSGGGLRRAAAPLRVRNYAIFWSGGLLSNIGRWLQDITVPYVLYQLTGRGSVIGLAAFLRFAPAVLIGPYSGALADRFHRKTVLVLNQCGLALVGVALWLMWSVGTENVAGLIVLSTLAGVVHALNTPTWQAFIAELVPRDLLAGAVTLSSAQMNAAKAIGPGLAGLVLATLGTSWSFFISAVLYSIVIVPFALLKVPRRVAAARHHRVLAAFAGTARYVFERKGLAASLAVMSVAAALGMPILQLTPVFATDVFEVGPAGFGVLAGALGFGGAASAPVLAGWTYRVPMGRLIAASLLGYGVAIIAFALAPTYPFAVVAMVLVGAGFLFTSATVISVLQLGVPDRLRGSVAAVFTTAFALAYPVGSLAQGWAVDHLGPRLTVTIAGLGLLVTAGLMACARRVQAELHGSAEQVGLEPVDYTPEILAT